MLQWLSAGVAAVVATTVATSPLAVAPKLWSKLKQARVTQSIDCVIARGARSRARALTGLGAWRAVWLQLNLNCRHAERALALWISIVQLGSARQTSCSSPSRVEPSRAEPNWAEPEVCARVREMRKTRRAQQSINCFNNSTLTSRCRRGCAAWLCLPTDSSARLVGL